MTKIQFLGRLRIQRLRLNPTLPGWEGNKSLLRLAGTLMFNHSQPSNYPGQYLCYRQRIFPAPMALIATQGANLSPITFTLLGPQKDLRPASQPAQLQQTSGPGRSIPIHFQALKTAAGRNSPSAKFRWEQAFACVSSGKRLISFFLL